jgi:DNA-binding MarR family transcriptional regulator
MEPRSLTRMLKSLEEKGWIYRETDPVDKRFVNVFLTELGKEKRNFARLGVIEFNNKLSEALSKEQLKTFFEVIQQINEIVEKTAADAKNTEPALQD